MKTLTSESRKKGAIKNSRQPKSLTHSTKDPEAAEATSGPDTYQQVVGEPGLNESRVGISKTSEQAEQHGLKLAKQWVDDHTKDRSSE